MSIASIELPIGLVMLIFGIFVGSVNWADSIRTDVPNTSGTVMLAALPIITGLQLVLAFFGHDVANTPRRTFHNRYKK